MSDIKRPTGVLVLVVIYIILALLRFGSALLVMIGEGTSSALMVFCLAPAVILGIIYLLIAVGLYALKRWAWILAVVFSIISILYALLNIYGVSVGFELAEEVDISSAFVAVPIISLVLNIVVLLVLWRNNEYFE